MDPEPVLDLHAIVPRSRANGPGLRFVVWVQGCDLACPGCFNPETHAAAPRMRMPVARLVARIVEVADSLDGVTLSGGEPLQQPAALLAVLAGVRARTSLSVVLFSGFWRREIERMALGPAILEHCDVLVDGRYVAARRLGRGLRGSANQIVHRLTDRYDAAQLDAIVPAEIHIAADGHVVLTGVDPPVAKPT